MNIRIASTAYALPSTTVDIDRVLAEERARIEAALAPLSERMRKRAIEGLGMKQVRVCGRMQPYDLALEAASQALNKARIAAREVDLILDFVTLPGDSGQYLSFSQKLSLDLGAETSLNLSYRVGGCAGLHLAMKNALALMQTDGNLRTALLVTADSPPQGSRSLLPITVQGDAGSAVVLTKEEIAGPEVLGTEVMTLGHLHDIITITRSQDGRDNMYIHVDSARIESELMPVYYLSFYRLVGRLLDRFALKLDAIDHVIYSNLSSADHDGFARALGLPAAKVISTGLPELGHTFGSDLVINYTDCENASRLEGGQLVLFASAGIGFTWGVTLARI